MGFKQNGSVLEDGLNISVMAESPGEAPMSESVAVPTKAMRPKLLTKLEKLEAGLQRARVAIKQASNGNQTDPRDPDFVPLGPMYWDSKAFHRYISMYHFQRSSYF